MTIAALLLAAGESTRMGRLKQLLPWDAEPLIAWQVRQLREAGAAEVVVVLGHAADEIRPAVPSEARVVVNEAYKQGRATSLKRGAEALPEGVEAVLILSVDQPRPSWLAQLLIERWRSEPSLIVSPRFARRFGHPILVDGSLVPELREVTDETLGLRAVIDRHVDSANSVPVSNDAVDVDLNTPDDYERAQTTFQHGDWIQPL
ncbi:MAG TPA: nucleotidyltransferase family protein [Dehalococcoidia bacterium]|nr:nucleotidyltransferase family protein [Dehalococcoidia bacterium]